MNNIVEIEFDRPLSGLASDLCEDVSEQETRNSEEMERLREKLAEREQKLDELRQQLTQWENVYKEKQEEMDLICDQLGSILDETKNSRAELMQDNEEDMVNFCLDLTEKILQHEIKHGRYKIEKILENALERVKDSSKVVIRVSPEDHDDASEAVDWLCSENNLEDVELVEDEEIPAASCRIEFDSGSVISDIHDRLQKIENEIMKQGGGQ